MRRNQDLPVRAASAVIMGVISTVALWLGGMTWMVFVLAVGVGVWLEWRRLVVRFAQGTARAVWSAVGAFYCGIAAAVLMVLRDAPQGLLLVLIVLLAVVATDVGAYFAGRSIGGPRIAPRISPSKTWAGLAGGIVLTCVSLLVVAGTVSGSHPAGMLPLSTVLAPTIAFGVIVAVVAQAGDFFQSWMKRRAGVKDSGGLLPGHGGLFDRLDGLLAVLFLLGIALPLVSPVVRLGGMG